METPIGDDDDSHLGDFIEDTSQMAPTLAAYTTLLHSGAGWPGNMWSPAASAGA